MKNDRPDCTTARERFDDALDDALAPDERAELEAHLARCDACRADFEGLEAAVSALAVGALAPTPRDHVDAVMARVRGEAGAGGGGVVVPLAPRRRGAGLLTHLVAAGIGAAIVWFLLDARVERSDRSGAGEREIARVEGPDDADANARRDAAGRTEPERVVVFHPLEVRAVRPVRTVEVPVEVPVEVAVEVPVPVEVPVEVRVEVPVPGEREAVDRRLAASAGALAAVLDRGARALESIADSTRAAERHAFEALELARAAAGDGRGENVDVGSAIGDADVPTAVAAPRPTLSAATDGGAVTIVREDARVRIATSGPTDEVIPALIAKLDERDAEIRAAVERRLLDLANGFEITAPGTGTGPAAADPWWRSNRGQAASTALGGASNDRAEAWRAWWEAVQGATAF